MVNSPQHNLFKNLVYFDAGLFIGLAIFLTYDHNPNRRNRRKTKEHMEFDEIGSSREIEKTDDDDDNESRSHFGQICKAFFQPAIILLLLGAIIRHAGK
jgi:hypothetical protein